MLARHAARLLAHPASALVAPPPRLAVVAVAAPQLRFDQQQVRQMARVVKGKGAMQKDSIVRRAAAASKLKAGVEDDDLEVGRIVSATGQHFEVELKSGKTFKVGF
eukprot:7377161-Prymnesium_polylepis.3